MPRLRSNRILPVALIVIIAIIAVLGLIALAQAIFFPGAPSASTASTNQAALLSTDVGRSVNMTVRGPIVADENFRSYEISIAPDSRVMTITADYEGTPTNSITLGNNVPAYREFVAALNKAGLVNGTAFTGAADNLDGVCAVGDVYDFSILNNGKQVTHLWTSTCSGSKGSLNANVNQLSNLFTVQIPGGRNLIDQLAL